MSDLSKHKAGCICVECEDYRAQLAAVTAELAAVKTERDGLALQVKDLLADVVKSDMLTQKTEGREV